MKKLISYLLALVLLLLAFPLSLIGCYEQTTDDSTASGTDTEQSSETEESTPMIISGDPNYTNVALNKTYTKSALHPMDAPSYPDEGNKSMTDGVRPAESANYSDKAFMGFNTNTDYKQNGYSLVTVDLGKIYYLDKFVVSTASSKFVSVGIDAPEIVWVYVSNDGKEWYCAGRTDHTDDPSKNLVECELVLDSAITARYVQFRLCANNDGWLFVSEVEAYGIEAEEAIPYPEQDVGAKILFVGNSSTYYFNTPYKLFFLCEAAGMNIDVEYCCFGGAYLYQYADANDQLGKLFRSKLSKQKYDLVVLQDNSNADYEQSKPALDVMLPLIRETGATAMLYKRYSSNSDPEKRLDSAYRHEVNYSKLSETFSIDEVAPVADAFLICTEKYPDINLYHTDNSHHSNIGAYLIACVWAITYLDMDLTDNTYTAGLDEKTADAIKECAKLACEQGYDFPQKNK